MENSSSSINNCPNMAAEGPKSTPGSSLKDRLAALRAEERAKVKPLQGMVDRAAPASPSEQTMPAKTQFNSATASSPNHAVDKETQQPASHNIREEPPEALPVPFVAPQALHYNAEHPTIVPEFVKGPDINLTTESGDLELATESAAGANKSPSLEDSHDAELSPFDFAIPLPMDSRVKDDYEKTLDQEVRTINRFLELSDSEALVEVEGQSIVSKLRRMVDKLGNICTHPDLNLPDAPILNVNNVASEASWAEYSSSKFLFLGYFIDTALSNALHVIVLVKPGRAADIMQTYLLGKEFSLRITPADNSDAAEMMVFERESLSFEIRLTTDESIKKPSKSPSLIIALDSSFEVDTAPVKELRGTGTPGHLVPVVRLVIASTAEHIRLCLPDCSDIMKLRLLVKYSYDFCANAGELQDDALSVQEDAEEILAYLNADPVSRRWSLPKIEEFDIEAMHEPLSISEQEALRSMTASRQKRWLEGEDGEDNSPSKRQRMTPLQDITHISDSVQGQTQESNTAAKSPETFVLNRAALVAQVDNLRSALVTVQGQLKAMENDFATLQYRYETKHKQILQARQDLDAALEGSKRSAARIEKGKDEIQRLREENLNLAKQLQEARTTIKEGGGPAADLEKSQEESRRLTAENEKLQRVVQQEKSQSEYTRKQYQNASTAAAQSALELRQLEEEIKELKQKASDEASRLKKLRLQNTEKVHLSRIAELETTLASRDQLLTRKEEEIYELKKNRPMTRSTSMQPRSPKFGASRPGSPGPSLNSIRASSALRFRAE